MLKRKKLKLREQHVVLISTALILIGIFFLSYNYVQTKRTVAYEYMSNLLEEELPSKVEKVTLEEEDEIPKNVEEVVPEEEKKVSTFSTPEVTSQYIGYLEIPKIHFRKGIVDRNSSDNNVNKNLFIASNSTYPDVENGNLIIAGHSGTGYKAFFKNLYQLVIGDLAKVEYAGRTYHYKVVKIYEQPKIGKIAIYRDYNKTTLTLVTCTKDKEDRQTIYILELDHIE